MRGFQKKRELHSYLKQTTDGLTEKVIIEELPLQKSPLPLKMRMVDMFVDLNPL